MARIEPALQTTTLWHFPSQHYGGRQQGSKDYRGATPSYVIWNLLQRYTKPKQLVIDPEAERSTFLVGVDLNRSAETGRWHVAPHLATTTSAAPSRRSSNHSKAANISPPAIRAAEARSAAERGDGWFGPSGAARPAPGSVQPPAPSTATSSSIDRC